MRYLKSYAKRYAKRYAKTVLLVTCLPVFGCNLGCNQGGTSEEAERQAILAAEAEYPVQIGTATPYYTGGPQQGRPPEGQLWPGTPVKVLQDAGSYSLIRTADGIEAYIETAAIGPPGVNVQ